MTALQEELDKKLANAIMYNRDKAFEEAIALGADVHTPMTVPKLGRPIGTPLHWSAWALKAHFIHELIKHGADRYALDSVGKTPREYDTEKKLPRDEQYCNTETKDALDAPALGKLLTSEGKATLPMLELCGMHRINEALARLFSPAGWQGREQQTMQDWQKIHAAMPPYWQKRFGSCIDFTPMFASALAPDTWRGREGEAIAKWNGLREAMPPYFQERYRDCVDMAPFIRRQRAAAPGGWLGRYHAEILKPGNRLDGDEERGRS